MKSVAVCFLLLSLSLVNCTWGQEPPSDSARAADAAASGDPKAAYLAALEAYKQSVRDIEKLRGEYQAADDARRKEINNQLSAQIKATQQKVDELVDAALAAYKAAPKGDPQIEELLVGVAEHRAVGQPIPAGGNKPSGGNHSGGDQYEKALPVINALIENGNEKPELPLWGFLSAFCSADYDLAEKYLAMASERGVFQNPPEEGNEWAAEVLGTAMSLAQILPEHRQLWEAEQKIRAAEAEADDLPRVKLTTSKGDIVIEMFENEAPQSVANFITLVKKGFYDGTPFHRVLPTFMAQGGDPTGSGTGGPGYSVRGEAGLPNIRKHFRGTLSMAHSGHPDSGGSQFFLTFRPTPHLDAKHTAFGRVIEGIDVLGELQRINPMAEPPHPNPDKIIKAEVVRDRGHDYKFDQLPDR
jgi:cyclophilin family peptidyl-prolyl cis-trans isomerase